MVPRWVIALLALLAALTIFDAVILVIRLHDVFAFGRLFLLPAEGPVVYAIWKVRHGYALYEWPFRANFTLTLYNDGKVYWESIVDRSTRRGPRRELLVLDDTGA